MSKLSSDSASSAPQTSSFSTALSPLSSADDNGNGSTTDRWSQRMFDTFPPSPAGFLLDSHRYDIAINGYLMPLLAAVTVVTNGLVVAVLVRRHMRTPTNVLLIALAASDTLTCVAPVPVWLRFYSSALQRADWVPYRWCFAYFLLSDYLPTMFHTVSVWLTTAVAGQRYLRVCRPPDSVMRRTVCSMTGSYRLAVGIFVVGVTSQLFRLAELTFAPLDLPSRVYGRTATPADDDDNNSNYGNNSDVVMYHVVTGCEVELSRFVADHETVYFNIYFWSRVVTVHLVPCTALFLFNLRLVKTMLDAARRRHFLRGRGRNRRRSANGDGRSPPAGPAVALTAVAADEGGSGGPSIRSGNAIRPQPPPPPVSECYVQQVTVVDSALGGCSPGQPARRPRVAGHGGHGSGSSRATAMLMIVVGVFLVVEIPLAVIFVMVIVENTFGVDLYADDKRHTAALFVNLFIAVSYPVNFFVYCSMNREFRRTFAAMLYRRN